MARMEESRGAYRILVGKPEERRPLGRPKRRWEDNIKLDLTDVGTVMNIRVLYKARNLLMN